MNFILHAFKMLSALMNSNNLQEMRELKLSGLVYNHFNSSSTFTNPQEPPWDVCHLAQNVRLLPVCREGPGFLLSTGQRRLKHAAVNLGSDSPGLIRSKDWICAFARGGHRAAYSQLSHSTWLIESSFFPPQFLLFLFSLIMSKLGPKCHTLRNPKTYKVVNAHMVL